MDSLECSAVRSRVTVLDGDGRTVMEVSDTLPQRRADTLNISGLSPDRRQYTVLLSVTDFFDGIAPVRSAVFGGTTEAVARSASPFRTRPGKTRH